MNYTLVDLLGSLAATLTFALFLLPPGYLLASLLDLASFRRRSTAEQLLWSVTLSLPLALLLCAVLGRLLPPKLILACFCALAALAPVRFFLDRRSAPPASSAPPDRHLRPILLAVAGLAIYLLLATSSIQVGPHLFESVNAADWSIRIPLVDAAIRNGVPPGNPFFTVAGHPQSARYYFYWYTLCAEVASLSHLPARACLSGSVLWSAFSLVSVLFLYLKHLAGIRRELHRYALIALGLCCVMGFDIIPAIAGLLNHQRRLAPEIEWWREDRVPSFLGAIIFAPHHVGGLVCAASALLLLSIASGDAGELDLPPSGSAWRRNLAAAIAAGLCFAATAGTSTYVAFCFAFICVFFGLDLLRHRRWIPLAALVFSGALALVISLPFLHQLVSGPALTLPSAAAADTGSHHFFKLTFRNIRDGRRVVGFFTRRLHHEINDGTASYILGAPVALILTLSELGFLAFPVILRIRRDLARRRSGDPFTPGERTLWAFFLGISIPALFLSSEPTQGINDLGRHAGLILRLLVIAWSVPVVAEFLDRRRARQPLWPRHPILLRVALACLVIGVATQLWQIVLDRTYLAIMHRTGVNPELPFVQDPDLAGRYFDLRKGFDTVTPMLPADAVIQINPGSRFQPVLLLYATRPFAAGDISCEGAFGGDPALCKPMISDLQGLFASPGDKQLLAWHPWTTLVAPPAEQRTTLADFRRVCADEHLSLIIANDTDAAWSLPTSWIWQQQPVYATPKVRFLPCPSLENQLPRPTTPAS